MDEEDLLRNSSVLVQKVLPFMLDDALIDESDSPETKRIKNQIYENPLSLYWINGEVFVASSFSTSLSPRFYYESIRGYVSGRIHEEPKDFEIEKFFLNKVGYDRGSFGIYITNRFLTPTLEDSETVSSDCVGWVSLVGFRTRVTRNTSFGLPKPPDIRNDFKALLTFLTLLGVPVEQSYVERIQADLDHIYEGT